MGRSKRFHKNGNTVQELNCLGAIGALLLLLPL